MPRKKYEAGQRDTELLEKLLVIQLYALGARRDLIARVVGRQKLWENRLLKGIPERGKNNGESDREINHG
ncbi:MAG: hypothetical protein EPO20_05350 [Betaproteobacteria bacterium]|nr:MAG: hypothetical protein EPO20_05350 [Betaproteobacteria bacterium]